MTKSGTKVEVARHLWLLEVRGGLITEAVGYDECWPDGHRYLHGHE